MIILKVGLLSDLLEGRGWTAALVQADNYCLYWSSRLPLESVTCDSNQKWPPGHSLCSLYSLLKNAYVAYTSEMTEYANILSFNDCCSSTAKTCSDFHIWSIILQLGIDMLIYVRAIWISDFHLYVHAL